MRPVLFFLVSFLASQAFSQTLYINEFMASNSYTFADEFGEFDDWLEIYNASSEGVYLGDKYLSDDHSNPNKWQMPDETIGPGEFLIFWCDEDQPQGRYHTNFKLSSSGEQLGIWDSAINNFAPIDTFTFGAVGDETPWGLYPDGQGPITELSWRTPGESNVPLSISEVERLSVEVFPNPTEALVTVRAAEPILEVQLLAADGRLRTRKTPRQRQTQFTLNHQVAGIYLLKIRTESQTVWKKIIYQP